MELTNVKGCFDYLPEKQATRDFVTETLKKVFMEYGYQPVETALLCYYDLLSSKYGAGAEILKEVYTLTDQGNRELGLRYDLTVPFAKLIAMNLGQDLQLPFKRYEIGRVFRDGPVKVGRNREFVQCDVDVVGIKNMLVDAEFIALYATGFKRLGIDVIIEYNNRKIMSGIIEEAGIKKEQINEVITIIDKFKKLTKEEFVNEFVLINIEEKIYNQITKYLSMDFEELKEEFKNSNNQILNEGIKELEEVNNYIKAMGLESVVSYTSSLARGHDIYTGTVYEVYAKDSEIKSSIGGGGRYDKIITNFIDDGNEYPAVGISFGLDVICAVLNKQNTIKKSIIDLYIIPMDTQAESLVIANKLRELGVNVDIESSNVKLKKSMTYANRANIPFVIILGKDEVEKGIVTIKNMNNGEQTSEDINNIKKIVETIKK